MAAAAHNPEFAKANGISQKVAKDFNKADSGKRDLRKKPEQVADSTRKKARYKSG